MSIWSTLGIERTEDPESIEQAYEDQLLRVDADSDPGRYRALRDAYVAAMREAGSEPQDEDFGVEQAWDADVADVAMPEPPTQEAELKAGQVMTALETVFSNPGWRDDLQRWRAQLEGEKAHKPGVTEVLRFRVFEFLSRQAAPGRPPVPEDILDYLEERLGWRRHRRQLEKAFSREQVSDLLGEPEPDPGDAASPLDLGPFPGSGSGEDMSQGMPKGMGFALIGWVLVLMVLTILFGEMR